MPPEKMIPTLFAPCAAQTLRGSFDGLTAAICSKGSLEGRTGLEGAF